MREREGERERKGKTEGKIGRRKREGERGLFVPTGPKFNLVNV